MKEASDAAGRPQDGSRTLIAQLQRPDRPYHVLVKVMEWKRGIQKRTIVFD